MKTIILYFFTFFILPTFTYPPQKCTKSHFESSWGTCEEEKDRQLQNFKNEATAYCKSMGGVNWSQTSYTTSQRGDGALTSCDFKGTIICNCPDQKDNPPPPPPPNPLGIKNSHEAL